MGGIFSDRQIAMMGNKESLDFHTSGWMSMIVDMKPVSGKDKLCFLNKSASSIQ